jgi:acylphosphatase
MGGMKRFHMIVSGRVQGVFYRHFARREAEKLDVTGYVKNLSEGNVEVVAEGEEEALKKFLAQCKKGPLMAFVKNIGIKEEPATGEFDGFDVRY